ncbi:hypothetical protein ACS0TY_004875 [Phlomoides rotata]
MSRWSFKAASKLARTSPIQGILPIEVERWNKVVFGDIDYNIDTKKNEIEVLDRIDDVMGLEEEDIIQ